MVWEYDFWEFKALTERYPDIAAFYIRYMELHWIIEKEPEEIALRQYTAKAGYEDFVRKYPHLIKRIKKAPYSCLPGHYTYTNEPHLLCQ